MKKTLTSLAIGFILQMVLLSITYFTANNFLAEGPDTGVSAFFSKLSLWSWGLIELKLVHTVNSLFSYVLAFIPLLLALIVPAVVYSILTYAILTLHENMKIKLNKQVEHTS